MKKYLCIVPFAAALFFSLTAYAQAKSNAPSLTGTWQLVSGVYTTKDTTIMRDSTTIIQIKVVTPYRFMFLTLLKANDSLLGAATGRVMRKGNMYIEKVEQSNMHLLIGNSYQYPINVVGKNWFLRGKVEQWNIDEVWKRVE